MSAKTVTITGVHPYADKFPMLPESEMVELARSIKANGLRRPIVITPEGLILDGRNRFAACQRAEVEPVTEVYTGEDLAEYVLDLNVNRRNMLTGARAMATALVLIASAPEGKPARIPAKSGGYQWRRGLSPESGHSKTWRDAMTQAGIVCDYAPKLAADVTAGMLALSKAVDQAAANRKADEDKAARRAELAEQAPKYLTLIAEETLTEEAAWAAHQEDTRKERERAKAERESAEQTVQTIAGTLIRLDNLQTPEFRARTRAAFAAYPEAAPPTQVQFHEPAHLRSIADWLGVYADELEEELKR